MILREDISEYIAEIENLQSVITSKIKKMRLQHDKKSILLKNSQKKMQLIKKLTQALKNH